ncbi:phage tail protein [Roseateles cellulosilyticus]|uniref:Tail fiber protein n=1 Tax=Pelomonas cellulosilytica TaxID=2906762 RepID=A0ABS8XXV3_9BURK|nr:tail fiber protein [Pelomonas sp. P8]MCE4554145.1 tail fiber protein [Pelomonas sp. P8]
MSNPFVAEIRVMPYNFAPKGWARCDGQLLPISQNTALFSLLGTTYGGNGMSNFALPNLDGSFAMGQGQGPGLSDRVLGETAGAPSVTLLPQEMPSHSHALMAGITPSATTPTGMLMAPGSSGNLYHLPGAAAPMDASAIGAVGSSQAHENRQPFQALSFCIAMQGVFPPRG